MGQKPPGRGRERERRGREGERREGEGRSRGKGKGRGIRAIPLNENHGYGLSEVGKMGEKKLALTLTVVTLALLVMTEFLVVESFSKILARLSYSRSGGSRM